MNTILLISIIVGFPVLLVIGMYNRLILLRNRINNAWHQIDVQLKRRFNLIPNLVKTVKGYVKHEKDTLKMVTEARTQLQKAKSPAEKAGASNMISSALKTLFAVAEAYPDLKANKNFMMLQEELSGTEGKIAYARQFYNDNVMRFNTAIQRFPTSILANLFKFKKKDYFEAKGNEKEPVSVEF